MNKSPFKKVAVIGGGAAGFFAAINIAMNSKKKSTPIEVTIFESSNQYLKKVRISGGGRCNVTHNLFEVRPFIENYPRGAKELLSPLQKFQAQDTVAWFKDRGIELVAEADGRMFPRANTSQAIIDCYMDAVEEYNIQLAPKRPVKNIRMNDSRTLELEFKEGESFAADAVVIATGSAEGGYRLAESLGHRITERAPSLFSFKIEDPLISDLAGLSFPNSRLKLQLPLKKKFLQNGPTLITHWGLSGPAILKLSAWAAREMKTAQYKAKLIVNWTGADKQSEVEEELLLMKKENSKSLMKNIYPEHLPKRFWLSLLSKCSINKDEQWAQLSKKSFSKLTSQLFSCELDILGQNRFKDEFVECGGVSLKEINFQTMESRICPNVYFTGEILDVDGVTGGFNFQNAWTTAWIAAQSISDREA